MKTTPRDPLYTGALAVSVLAAFIGLIFAATSTHDFITHLDRQTHSLNCSFIPGLLTSDLAHQAGCKATLMSRWSSVFRSSLWGGIPISLLAMSVFAYLIHYGLGQLVFAGQMRQRTAHLWWVLSWCLPALSSLVMGGIAAFELGAACTLCIGIYLSSAAGLAGAVVALARFDAAWVAEAGINSLTPPPADPGDPFAVRLEQADLDPQQDGLLPEQLPPQRELSFAEVGLNFAQGVVFVALPVAMYTLLAPDHSPYIGQCGALLGDPPAAALTVDLDDNRGATPALELFDPLCEACEAFETRLHTDGFDAQLHREALLFPLDSACNWMLDTPFHPGACKVSEAILCAEASSAANGSAVIDWVFANRQGILALQGDETAIVGQLTAQFPAINSCLTHGEQRGALRQSLRWIAQNRLPLLTPQLYINNKRLCDEDTDLGLAYALPRLSRLGETP